MKHLTLALALALLGLSACNASPKAQNHWDPNYVGTSMSRAFFGWTPRDSKETWEDLKADGRNVELIVYRHVLSTDPQNPLQGD